MSPVEHREASAWDRQLIGDIVRPLEDRPLIAEFLTWLDEQIDSLKQWGSTIAAPAARRDPANPSAGPFSVGEAARVLSRDPVIAIGRDALFEWMHTRQWCEKRGDAWQPRRELIQYGLLTVQERALPTGQKYPQILITATGLESLHRHLGGVAELNFVPSVFLVEENQ